VITVEKRSSSSAPRTKSSTSSPTFATKNAGTRDFYGNTIPMNGVFDVGANEAG
jgi:hypothetical protein